MRRNCRFAVAAVLVNILSLNCSGIAYAEFTFIGPIPYRSAADSPFNLSGLGTTVFLEDFEDGLLTPGVESGFPLFIGPLAGNSVDADDGLVDGLDSGGHSSIAYFPEACAGSSCTVQFQWIFIEAPFGRYPTAVGIVLTANSGAMGHLTVAGFGKSGNEVAIIAFEGIVSSAFDATDDSFIGVVNPYGISQFTFSQLRQPIPGTTSLNPSYDHLQYGLYVPEPSSFALAAMCSLVHWMRSSHSCI
jgi:hypothetical protein